MSAFQEPRYDVSPLPSSPPRRIRRRVWVWAGFVLVSTLIGALAGAGGVLLFGGFALLLVALVALVRPRWIGARTRAVAAAVAAIGLAGAISGTALAGTSAPGSGPTGVPSTVTTEPSQVPTTAPSVEPTDRSTPSPSKPTTTTSTPTTTPDRPKAAAGTALAAVDELRVKGRAPKSGYDRSAYGTGWRTVDGCSTREIILRRDLDKVTVARSGDCAVVAGTLHDPYTGTTERLSAATMDTADIDHVVALGDSWQKGAQQWSRTERVRFANDPLNLLVTSESINASKGDGDTATWLPPNKSFRCAYVARQVSVKTKYDLSVTRAEQQAMTRVLSGCPDQKLISAADARDQRDPHPTVAQPKTTPTTSVPKTSAPKKSTEKKSTERKTGSSATDPRFPTCAAANRAGYGPYQRGVDTEYNWYIDRDHDGLVCER